MKKILVLIIILLTGCSKEDYSTNLFYMDTLINIKLYNVSEKESEKAFEQIEKLYQDYELIVSKYDENSELYKLNNGNTNVSEQLIEMINKGLEWSNASEGLLNINIGDLTQIWSDFRNQTISLPTNYELNSIDINMDNFKIEDNKIEISGNVNIDLGAIAKGYVSNQAKEILHDLDINEFIINAGGNVIVGESAKGYYNIGIASPISDETFMVIKDENISVVTSGSYERFYEYEGISYHHIIDPITRYPANHMKSVTVIGKDSGLCDALSTILFLMPIEKGQDFITNYDVEVIWFTNQDQIITSENFSYEEK